MTNKFKDYIQVRQAAMAAMADAAIALGIPVFPCNIEKQPLTTHGFKDATTDSVTIKRMFTTAAVMIGVPMGEITGIVVIDVDQKKNRQGMDWLNANSHRLPQTYTVRTGSGGLHLYFKWPSQNVKNSNDKIAPGIDVRGDGGYVIVPPSPGYQVADDAPPADLPDWLLPVLCPPDPPPLPPIVKRMIMPASSSGTPYGLKALNDECDAIQSAPFGSQEHTLNSAGLKIGSLVAGGYLDESTALSNLLAAARTMPSQPGKARWAVSQLEAKARRAFTDGKRTPRSAPEIEKPDEGPHPAAQLLAKLSGQAGKKTAQALPVTSDLMDVGGVLKALVEECNRTALRPQPFLALAAAICAVGVLAGRKYRTKTDLRTNMYAVAIAESGGGKDHAAEIIRRTIDAAELGHYLGGETIASGRAVLSSVENHPARLFQVDEFGMFLSGVTGKYAAPHKAEIWSEFMKLFSRAKGIYRGTEYANKKENPRVDIHEPHVCFHGTTTPDTFWKALQGGAMSDGSLARLLVFITDNNRPSRNKAAGIYVPPDSLIADLQAVTRGKGLPPGPGNLPALHVAQMVASQSDPSLYTVPMTPAAEALHDKRLDGEDLWARKVEGTPQAAIVNRLGENAAKLALISAISWAPEDPTITERDVAWGWALAEHCARSLLQEADRFIADTEFEARLNKALNIIRKHGPCSARDMYHKGFKFSERDRKEVIDTLVNNGVINAYQSQPASGAGRPSVKYVIAGSTQEPETGDGIP